MDTRIPEKNRIDIGKVTKSTKWSKTSLDMEKIWFNANPGHMTRIGKAGTTRERIKNEMEHKLP